jgi:nucleoside diphosphate kinase
MSDTPKMTFAIIKPDAVRAGNVGGIIQRITDNGFKIRAMKWFICLGPSPKAFMTCIVNDRFSENLSSS